MLRHIRRRSAQNVVDEISEIHRRWGHRGFMFYDDELNVDRGMSDLMRRIAAAQQAAGVEWRLRGFVKAELFTEEQAEAMYAAASRHPMKSPVDSVCRAKRSVSYSERRAHSADIE